MYDPLNDTYKLNISDDELLSYFNNKNKTTITDISFIKTNFSRYIEKIATELFSDSNLENDDYFIELLSISSAKLREFIIQIPPFNNGENIEIMISSIISTYVTPLIYTYQYSDKYCKDGTHTIENKDDIIKINGKCYDINIILNSINEDLNKIDPIYPRIKDISKSIMSIDINLKKIHKYIKDKGIRIEKPVDLFFNNLHIFEDENTQEIKKLFVNNDLQYSFKNNKWKELSESNINDFINDIKTIINKFDNTNINGINNKKYENDIYHNNLISDDDIYEK